MAVNTPTQKPFMLTEKMEDPFGFVKEKIGGNPVNVRRFGNDLVVDVVKEAADGMPITETYNFDGPESVKSQVMNMLAEQPDSGMDPVEVSPLQPSEKDIKGPSTETGIPEPEAVEPIRTEAEMPSKVLDQANQGEPLVSQIGQAIQRGNSDEAIRLIDAALGAQDVVDRFRKDLTPESMNADLLRAFSERRQGRNPSMTLTRTGQFGGEKRSPDEIERTGQRDRFGMLRELVGTRQRGEAIKNDISRIESNIALRVAELERLNKQFATQQDFLRDREAVGRANSIIDGLFKQADMLTKQLELIPESEEGNAEFMKTRKRIADKLELAQKLRLKLLGN